MPSPSFEHGLTLLYIHPKLRGRAFGNEAGRLLAMAFKGLGSWACRAAVAASAWVGPTQAQDAHASVRLSTGHVIVMAPVGAMDCAALSRKLEEIDATGYRGARPAPREASDMPLLRYENTVSNRYYSRCVTMQEAGAGDTLFRGRFKGPSTASAAAPAGAVKP